MPTILFDKIVFGPVQSRRLGVSLGINLLPVAAKVCNFDCVYCECGLNNSSRGESKSLPSRKEVYLALDSKLSEMSQNGQAPDVITFAGNGEPTLHPEFSDIIDDTIKLRNQYFQSARISVLSNSTMLHKSEVVEALKKVDQNILKLDSGVNSTIEKLNQPVGKFDLQQVTKQLKEFTGQVIIQTMFVRGEIKGVLIDNTTESDLIAWEMAIKEVNPQMVMIYTIERETPYQELQKVPASDLKKIAERIAKIGIEVKVYG